MINFSAIYVLWLREVKKYWRAKSRIIGTLAVPLFFLAFLGLGLGPMEVPGVPRGVEYMRYLVPGIVGMTMLFSSMIAGLSVLVDRDQGFLKEIMVAPVNRLSIVLGRIAGGITTALAQGTMIILISFFLGFRIRGVPEALFALVFLILIAATFIGLGLVFASNMRDVQGFGLVMNFVIFPIFFLSGALYPVANLPAWLRVFSYLDPLTYGVDGLRGTLIGVSALPVLTDFLVLALFSILMVALGTYFFEKNESV